LAILGLAVAGHGDREDRCAISSCPNAARGLVAIDMRESHIDECGIRDNRRGHVDPRRSVRRLVDGMSLAGKPDPSHLPRIVVVLDDEDAARRRG
jgi:hypothetical protein